MHKGSVLDVRCVVQDSAMGNYALLFLVKTFFKELHEVLESFHNCCMSENFQYEALILE
jgi:hypothetical protein